MKLSDRVIFDALSESEEVEFLETTDRHCSPLRAKLLRSETQLEEGYAYVAAPDRLPLRPIFHGHPLLICVGGRPPMPFRVNCCCIHCKSGDVFRIFDKIEEIFARFNQWESQMLDILNTTADLQAMLDASMALLREPMYIMDGSFRMIASPRSLEEECSIAKGKLMPLCNLSWSKMCNSFSMDTKEPFLICGIEDSPTVYAANFFSDGRNAGCFFVMFKNREYRESDCLFLNRLRSILQTAITVEYSQNIRLVNPFQSALQSLLNGEQIEPQRRNVLQTQEDFSKYICVRMFQKPLFRSHIPTTYVLSQFETEFSKAVIFEFSGSFVAFVPIIETDSLNTILRGFAAKMKEMGLIGGYSMVAYDLVDARSFYIQASAALEFADNGEDVGGLYSFCNYKLQYFLTKGLSELSLSSLIPEKLKQLCSYDEKTSVNYRETLFSYLVNNMSITKTSEDLHIHRSTFLTRLSKIEQILGNDFATESEERVFLVNILFCMRNEWSCHEKQNIIDDNKFDTFVEPVVRMIP